MLREPEAFTMKLLHLKRDVDTYIYVCRVYENKVPKEGIKASKNGPLIGQPTFQSSRREDPKDLPVTAHQSQLIRPPNKYCRATARRATQQDDSRLWSEHLY